ncbi:MAG: hypothetical protein HYZ53_18810 [Planctomycetes bacterium]|nr:hypothetical protein [Planctomycetota bacterium]
MNRVFASLASALALCGVLCIAEPADPPLKGKIPEALKALHREAHELQLQALKESDVGRISEAESSLLRFKEMLKKLREGGLPPSELREQTTFVADMEELFRRHRFTYQWICKGPFTISGAIRHLLVDPLEPHRLYAAAENGGLWVLDDHEHPEQGWRPLTDDLENLQMRGIAKSSLDRDYIATANAAGFVYHSKDSGRTWSKVVGENFHYIRRILIADRMTNIGGRTFPNFPRLVKETSLWIACSSGLFRIRLINGAVDSVERLYPQTPAQQNQADVLDAVRNPVNGDLYVGVRGQGVLRRRERPAVPANAWTLSANWATLGDQKSAMIKLAITGDGSCLVAKLGRNVFTNDAAGASTGWTPATTVPFDKDDVGGSDVGYRGNFSGAAVPPGSGAKGEWAHAVAISPADRNVIAVGQAPLFISRSGGQPGANGADAWAKAKSGHEDIQSLAFSRDGASLFIANDGGVFKLPMPSGSAALKDLNNGLATAQFYRVALNGRVAIGNPDHQGILGTRDIEPSPPESQPEWEVAYPPGNGFGNHNLENDFVSADPKTPGRFFVQYESEHLLRLKFPRTSGGTQDLLPLNDTTIPLRPFTGIRNNNPVFNQLNYAVGTVAVDPRERTNTILVAVNVIVDRKFGIKKTQNANVDPSGGPKIKPPEGTSAPVGGLFETPVTGFADWTSVFDQPDPPQTDPIVSITFSPSEPGKAYALDQAGRAFVLGNVDDSGDTFQPAGAFPTIPVPPDYARQIVADPRTPGRLLALSHRQIQLSTDGAQHWTPIGQPTLPAAQLNALCLHPTTSKIVYLATASDVFVSYNGGVSWRSIGIGLPNAPVMQVFTSPTHLYAVTFGRGLWRARLPD